MTAYSGDHVTLPGAPEGVSLAWRLQQGDVLQEQGDGSVVPLVGFGPGAYTIVAEINEAGTNTVTLNILLIVHPHP
jgi:hypothetical protein